MILSFDNGKAFIPKCGYKKSNESIILCQDCSIKVIEIQNKIKGFQEGEKLAIKIIDEHLKDFKGCGEYVWYDSIKDGRECGERIGFPDLYLFCDECKWKQERIEELKKQREHLEWESKLE